MLTSIFALKDRKYYLRLSNLIAELKLLFSSPSSMHSSLHSSAFHPSFLLFIFLILSVGHSEANVFLHYRHKHFRAWHFRERRDSVGFETQENHQWDILRGWLLGERKARVLAEPRVQIWNRATILSEIGDCNVKEHFGMEYGGKGTKKAGLLVSIVCWTSILP